MEAEREGGRLRQREGERVRQKEREIESEREREKETERDRLTNSKLSYSLVMSLKPIRLWHMLYSTALLQSAESSFDITTVLSVTIR